MTVTWIGHVTALWQCFLSEQVLVVFNYFTWKINFPDREELDSRVSRADLWMKNTDVDPSERFQVEVIPSPVLNFLSASQYRFHRLIAFFLSPASVLTFCIHSASSNGLAVICCFLPITVLGLPPGSESRGNSGGKMDGERDRREWRQREEAPEEDGKCSCHRRYLAGWCTGLESCRSSPRCTSVTHTNPEITVSKQRVSCKYELCSEADSLPVMTPRLNVLLVFSEMNERWRSSASEASGT